VTDLPPAAVPAVTDRLADAMDIEGKIPRALEALGLGPGRPSAIVDVPGTPWADRVRRVAPEALLLPGGEPGGGLVVPAPDGSLALLVTLWTGFRGVADGDLEEVDRVLAPGGRLLVVHDYGRDDVSRLRPPEAPEYGFWSRRDGPFLRGGGFRIRVIHCFWTFTDLDAARDALAMFGATGEAVGSALRRPRLSWNVAVYHRWQGGAIPVDAAGP
jgi:hypothetical protein